MKYFDALKRKKVYLSSNTKEFNFKINSKDYINLGVEEQLPFLEEIISKEFSTKEDLAYGNLIKIDIYDEGENILDDQSIFGMMSNVAVIYTRMFEKQKEYVASPKQRLLDNLPITPFVSYLMMSTFVVSKPVQIIIGRNHEESGSYEEVELIS